MRRFFLSSVVLLSSAILVACVADGSSSEDDATDPDGDGDGGGDGGGGAYEICINKINELRATKGLDPYARWSDGESCADQQSAADEASGNAHGSFGDCGESAQNQCLGGGAANIEGCLDMMWAEKDQAGCAGCDACADEYTPDCPDCDFYGNETGQQCGHYVNMRAEYFTMAACGFSTGWATINFR
jgi:hypothetical protein